MSKIKYHIWITCINNIQQWQIQTAFITLQLHINVYRVFWRDTLLLFGADFGNSREHNNKKNTEQENTGQSLNFLYWNIQVEIISYCYYYMHGTTTEYTVWLTVMF